MKSTRGNQEIQTYVIVLIVRQDRIHLDANKTTGLVSPCSGNVSHCVATTAENKSRESKTTHEVNAIGMSSHAQIEAAKSVTRQAVTTTLEDDCLRLIVLHDSRDDRLEDGLVRGVGDTVAERKVDGIVLACADTNVAQLTSTWEVLAVFVEGDGHDTVGCVEGLLNAISVVDINVDVQNALLESEELNDGKNNI